MTPLIEAMARAMCIASYAAAGVPYDRPTKAEVATFEVEATAALTVILDAMEEPSREMWARSGDAVVAIQNRGGGHHDMISGAIWSAMLAQFRKEALNGH